MGGASLRGNVRSYNLGRAKRRVSQRAVCRPYLLNSEPGKKLRRNFRVVVETEKPHVPEKSTGYECFTQDCENS